jgi:hypothetical protein
MWWRRLRCSLNLVPEAGRAPKYDSMGWQSQRVFNQCDCTVKTCVHRISSPARSELGVSVKPTARLETTLYVALNDDQLLRHSLQILQFVCQALNGELPSGFIHVRERVVQAVSLSKLKKVREVNRIQPLAKLT